MSSSIQEQRLKKWLDVLGGYDAEMSKIAADKLAELGDPRAIGALVTAMQHRTELVAAASAKALGAIGNESAVPHLIKTLKFRHDVLVQTAAAEALGAMKTTKAIPALKKEIKDYLAENKEDRFRLTRGYKRGLFTTCIQALKVIGTPDAIRFAKRAERSRDT